MSWMNALKPLLDLKSTYDEVDKIRGYSKKIEKADPKKLKWDDLKYFNNKTMDRAIKAAREALKLSKAAEKKTLEWPKCDSLKVFGEALTASKNHGADSPQAKKAVQKYIGVLKTFDKDQTNMLAGLQKNLTVLTKKITKTEAMRNYANVLQQAFMKCANIPSVNGTAQNAMFLSLSQDAGQFKGLATELGSSLKRLEKMNTAYIKECETRIKNNKLWISFASSGKAQADGALEKNKSSVKPK